MVVTQPSPKWAHHQAQWIKIKHMLLHKVLLIKIPVANEISDKMT